MPIPEKEEQHLAGIEAQMDQMIASAAADPLKQFAYQMGKVVIIPFLRELVSRDAHRFTRGEVAVAVASTLSSMLELYLITGKHEMPRVDAIDILKTMLDRVLLDDMYGDPRKGTIQ